MKKVLSFIIIALIALVALSTSVNAASASSEAELETALAGEDTTITLSGNVVLAKSLEIGKFVTIDLNGYSITPADEMTDDSLIIVLHGGTLIVKDSVGTGKISATNSAKALYGIKMTKQDGDVTKKATLIVNSGTIEGTNFGITGNGSKGRENTDITISGGTIKGINGAGIYQPQLGNLAVNGGTVQGTTGIEIRSGTLGVSGGTIIGTAKPTNVTANGSGTTTVGTGIAIAQHTTKNDIKVSVNGGSIQGYSALYHSNPQENTTNNVSIEVSGGKFKTINDGTVAVYSKELTKFITGGTFSSDVKEYIAEGVICKNVDNSYLVGKESTITVKEVEGGTVTASATKAVAGETITLEIKANSGYELKELDITDVTAGKGETITGETEFTMWDEDVVIVAEFVKLTQEAEVPSEVADAEKVEEALLEELKSNEDFAELIKNNNVTVELEFNKKEEKDMAVEDKKEIEEAASKKSEDIKIVKYIDITINVKNKEDGTVLGNLEDLKEKITFTVAVPEDLPELKEGYTRTYYVVRNHKGDIKFLDTKVSEDGKSLEFSSDLFSTYAIAYSDEKVEEPKDDTTTKPSENTTQKPSEEKDESPKMGSIDIVVYASAIVAVISLAGIVMVKKYTK